MSKPFLKYAMDGKRLACPSKPRDSKHISKFREIHFRSNVIHFVPAALLEQQLLRLRDRRIRAGDNLD
jgi:hypothetical protein